MWIVVALQPFCMSGCKEDTNTETSKPHVTGRHKVLYIQTYQYKSYRTA